MPTYNERENIEELLTAIFDLNKGIHVLVVDDNSPDGTAEVVIKLQQYHANALHLLKRSKKEGLGQAYLAGFSFALAAGYAYICSMDADWSHAPADLCKLLNLCAHEPIDMVIGSRYIAGGRIVNWPHSRICLSYMANWIARIITGIAIKDTTAGFICYRRELLAAILLVPIVSVGYSFQVEMKFLAHQKQANIVEWPITFTNRVKGQSKMNRTITWQSFLHLLQMKWNSWFGKMKPLQ
ncbi:MAG: polyprenol monophosphomannose synthase [Candidatus Cardinium sp.]|nr:polyprenol monophosphomannose synthase [Candidatus Cardinium sp.]